MSMQSDGTFPWPPAAITPIDKVALALADVKRARVHVDVAMEELAKAVARLIEAARGGHR